jgi:menaquinone-specific isochorismate synthase
MRCETEAVAGSAWAVPSELDARNDDEVASEAAHGLLASAKNRHEHEVVVRFLRDRLKGYLELDAIAEGPAARRVSNLWHLTTPLTGTLREPHHVLEMVEALHPTPAVGGRPVEASLRLIEQVEDRSRGWYASPVGWFDAAGDGDFFVALRSMLVSGARATLFAGAGIVTGSDPETELAELSQKLHPARRAIRPWARRPASVVEPDFVEIDSAESEGSRSLRG